MNKFKLRKVNLPKTATVKWCHLYEDDEDHICDEDIAYIELNSGIFIDAGQYGRLSFFRVEAVTGEDGWEVIEQVECKTTKEVAEQIELFSFKYSD